MSTQEIQSDNNDVREQKLMQRYARSYASKTGEKPLSAKDVDEILRVIVAVTVAAVTPNPVTVIVAAKELVHLAMEYGPIVWKMYDNYRRRQKRQEKNQGNVTVPPTQKKLQKLLAEHEVSAEKAKMPSRSLDHVA